VVSVTDPYGRILGFLDRRRYFSIKQLLSCTHEAECTPRYFEPLKLLNIIESLLLYP
jgi:hypothetical protein